MIEIAAGVLAFFFPFWEWVYSIDLGLLTYFAYFGLDEVFSTTELKDTCIFFCLLSVFWGSDCLA